LVLFFQFGDVVTLAIIHAQEEIIQNLATGQRGK
jgi:hypothetical protein